ncbi:MAG: response regulator transcription factor [Alphaproteobacteria bacterium]
MTGPIRIVLADDHALVRDGIRARLETFADIVITGEATNGREAIELVNRLRPDLVMLDISMPVLGGLQAATTIRAQHAEIGILVLSIYDNSEYVRGAIQAGANGYILKDVSATGMVDAIRSVANGGTYFSRKVTPNLFADSPGDQGGLRAGAKSYGLTERECQILGDVARGLANKEIARKYELSVRTVESHRKNLRDKVGGGNAADLAGIASELGLI